MSLHRVKRELTLLQGKKRKETGVKGDTWITWQTALLNCAKVGRTSMWAGWAFQ